MQTRASCGRKSSCSRNWIGCVATTGSFVWAPSAQRGAGLRGVALVAGAVQFEEVAARERGGHPLGGEFRGLDLAGEQQRADVAVTASRQRDQALREAAVPFLEPLEPHLGAIAMLVLQVRPRQQVTQVQVARAVLDEDGQAERVVAVGVVRDPQVAADDRLDALLARRGIEPHGTEDVGAVRQRQRALPVARRLPDRLVDPNDAVDDGELGVEPEMDETRAAHRWNSATRSAFRLWITRRTGRLRGSHARNHGADEPANSNCGRLPGLHGR